VILAEPPNEGTDGSALWLSYRFALRTLAETYGAMFLDVTERWGTYEFANAEGLIYDNHPDTAGHLDEWNYLDETLFVDSLITPALGANALVVGSAAGSSSVVLGYAGAWTATANDSFLHISAASASGTGCAVVVFTYDAFIGTGTRTGTLTIAGLTVTVTQAGTNYIGPGPVIALVSTGLNQPSGVAVDGSGNVYIADTNNNAIEEWSAPTQAVSTLMSTGLNRPRGVAVDVSGNVYIADTSNGAIKEWSAAMQQETMLVSTGLNRPSGVAVDGSGNVYIADTSNGAIKEWSAATQQETMLVSTGLNQPSGVAVDGSGNVYIADTDNNAIKEMPYAFVGPASLTEPASAGSGSLLPVLPATVSLAGVFTPASDQNWLSIGTIANGVVGFSFSANTSSATRVAHITILGQQITVRQNGLPQRRPPRTLNPRR